MRARLMTMPFSTGSAPPLRPVPEPRATKGIFSRWQRRRMAWTSCGGCGEEDGLGHGAEIGEGVALVGVEFVGGGDEGAGADDGAELLEEARVHGGRLPEWGGKVKRGEGRGEWRVGSGETEKAGLLRATPSRIGGRRWGVGRRTKQIPFAEPSASPSRLRASLHCVARRAGNRAEEEGGPLRSR